MPSSQSTAPASGGSSTHTPTSLPPLLSSSRAPLSQSHVSFSSRSGESSGSQLDDMLDSLDPDSMSDQDPPAVLYPHIASRRRPPGLAVTRRTVLVRQDATLA